MPTPQAYYKMIEERDAAVLERDTAITDAADRIKDLLDEIDKLRVDRDAWRDAALGRDDTWGES